VTPGEAALLVVGGLLAGVVNTLAGGGSMVTVPLLVLLGVPGVAANGTNRVGILIQSAVAAWRFRAEGVSGFSHALPVLVPLGIGSAVGAYFISGLADETFERLFGVVMVLLLIPLLRPSGAAPLAWRSELHGEETASGAGTATWPRTVSFLVFLAIGLYGGALQVGSGLVLVFALSHAGYDLVRANSVKMVVIFAVTLVAVPVFIAKGQVEWTPALLLACVFAAG
jgi:uncharacterized membrane protein YfcA